MKFLFLYTIYLRESQISKRIFSVNSHWNNPARRDQEDLSKKNMRDERRKP